MSSGDRLLQATTSLSELLMRPPRKEDTPIFRILVDGKFSQDQIVTSWSKKRVTYPRAVQEKIEKNWKDVLRRKPKTFPGPLVRLNTLGVDQEGNLILGLGPTNYKDYIGTTNLSEPERQAVRYELANPLGVALLIFSKDAYGGEGALLFDRRSTDLALRPGGLAFPAGNVEMTDTNEKGEIDPIVAGIREAKEEQGVEPEELENIQVIGVVYETYQDAAPVLLITADLRPGIDIEELKSRPKDEEGEALWVPNEPKKLARLAAANIAVSLPVVQAGIYLYLKINFPDTELAEYVLAKTKKTRRNL